MLENIWRSLINNMNVSEPPIEPNFYQSRKFILHFGKSSGIFECEVIKVKPQPLNLKDNEFLYEVKSPKVFAGEKIYSMFFRDSIEECQEQAKESLLFEANRNLVKKGISFTEEDIVKKVNEVKVFRI
jgi:hypothetical protein